MVEEKTNEYAPLIVEKNTTNKDRTIRSLCRAKDDAIF